MITGIAFLVILGVVALRGGDLSRLATVRPRHAWTVMAAILVQVVIISLLAESLPFAAASGLHLFSYGLALAFVWLNRTIPGIGVTVFGGVLNLVAIVANGGVMPASRAALEFAGKPVETGEFENSAVQADANLAMLGDVFALPHGMPFANVFSLGDVVLLIGGYLLVSRACLGEARPSFKEPVLRRLRQLESDKVRLERVVVEQARDVDMLKQISRNLAHGSGSGDVETAAAEPVR